MPRHLSPTMSFTPSSPRPRSHWKKFTQLPYLPSCPLQHPEPHRYLTSPQSIGNILHTAYGNACKIHLYEGLFYVDFITAVTLNDSGLEGDTLEPWHMQGNITRGSSQVAVIVTASVTLMDLIALIPSSLGQLVGFCFQKTIQCLLYTSSD